MRSDRDKRTDNEREIDDFLAQFDTPVDELSADINSYLDAKDTTKLTAAHTFYGAKVSELAGSNEEAAEFSDASSEDNTLPSEAVVTDAHADTSVSPADDQAIVSPVLSDDKGPEQAEKTEKKKKKSRRKKSPVESKAKAELQAAGAKISEGADKVASKVKNIKAEDVKRELFLKKNPNFDPDKTVSGSNKQYENKEGAVRSEFTGTEYGTAVHRILELFDYGRFTHPASVSREEFDEWRAEISASAKIPPSYVKLPAAGIMAFLIIMTLGIVIIDKRIEIMGDVNPSYTLEK